MLTSINQKQIVRYVAYKIINKKEINVDDLIWEYAYENNLVIYHPVDPQQDKINPRKYKAIKNIIELSLYMYNLLEENL